MGGESAQSTAREFSWYPTLPAAELPTDGTGRSLEVGGMRVALFAIEGRLHALDDTCPHQGACLGDGVVVEGDVTCPWHSFHFDLVTGRNTDGLEHCVAVYATRLRTDGVVEVALGAQPD